MRGKLLFVTTGLVFMAIAAPSLRADQVEMQNGDHYSGTVVSVSADTLVLESPVLGRISVPRKKVVSLAFGTNAPALFVATNAPRAAATTNLPVTATLLPVRRTSPDLAAELRNTDTNSIRQIREQMLGTSPEAAGKFDEMLGALASGKMDMTDLRRQAQSSADQLRQMKRELGPDADDSVDGYLSVLDDFLKETASRDDECGSGFTAKNPDTLARLSYIVAANVSSRQFFTPKPFHFEADMISWKIAPTDVGGYEFSETP